ncbi:uncharacterized protein DC041_0004569 [Schistosoma bovis]|uniref:Fucosyltransferase n=1 Tax=Schistosoma bovis TaxID=6184 RepID=A0A430PZW0_SCHBO|nr:uncharacterized protein DC041_0004569 [Schistosoma bovis]
MGASIEEYERVAPPYSFIHVDQFESPAKLADYLKYLDKNDTAYNEYFAWHDHGIIHDRDSQPQCAMCLLAHTSHSFGPYWVPRVARDGGMMDVMVGNCVGILRTETLFYCRLY